MTLYEILEQKDKRHARIKFLAEMFKANCICLKINYPGSDKKEEPVEDIFNIAFEMIENLLKQNGLKTLFSKKETNEVEFEGYFVVDHPIKDLKILLSDLEDQNEFTRLFDIDVHNALGQSVKRIEIGRELRKCLLCDYSAFYCQKNKTHSLKELKEKIREIYNKYKLEKMEP